jgi:hypothetical protein
MYKQYKNIFGEIAQGIFRVSDNTSIPFDQANTDYQAYLKWVSEGNTPLPAEETI